MTNCSGTEQEGSQDIVPYGVVIEGNSEALLEGPIDMVQLQRQLFAYTSLAMELCLNSRQNRAEACCDQVQACALWQHEVC